MQLPDPCPTCGAVELDDRMLSWHGTTLDGRPVGDVKLWVECAACGARFGRGAGGMLTTPEVAAECQREQARGMAAKIEAVYAQRARESAKRAATQGGAPDAEPGAAPDRAGITAFRG
jgi:hypothetical protein